MPNGANDDGAERRDASIGPPSHRLWGTRELMDTWRLGVRRAQIKVPDKNRAPIGRHGAPSTAWDES